VSAGFPTLPRPGQNTPPPTDWLRLVSRQLFEEMHTEHRRGLGFAALRQVEVVAVDPVTTSATVILGGDVDHPIEGVKTLPAYVPRVGDVPWCHQNGSDLLLAGGPGYELPKVEIRKGDTSALNSGEEAYINFGATPTFYGSDRYGMYEPNDSRFVFPWPGAYRLEYHAHWAEASSGRRQAQFEDDTGAIRASARIEWDLGSVAMKDPTTNPARTHRFNAGQWVRVKAYQSSGGPLSILDEPFSNVVAITYQG
jgi:hypothetical protein